MFRDNIILEQLHLFGLVKKLPPFKPKRKQTPKLLLDHTFFFPCDQSTSHLNIVLNRQISKKMETQEDFTTVLTISDPRQIRSALQAHLRKEARRVLMPMIEHEANAMKATYKNIRFKRQKSIWGSCSELGNLNFNLCLIFLPRAVARYVIVHELAHLEHLNHGRAFWNKVENHDPDFQMHRAALRRSDELVPIIRYRNQSLV